MLFWHVTKVQKNGKQIGARSRFSKKRTNDFFVVKSKKAKIKQIHSFVFCENLRRANQFTVLSDL